MKQKFFGYYRLSEKQLKELWENATFVLDTNVLLDVYRYTSETSKNILTILEKVANRLWIPYQVASEYHSNLNNVICEEIRECNSVTVRVQEFQKYIQDISNQKRKHPFIDIEFVNKLQSHCDEIYKIIDSEKEKLQSLLTENSLKETIAQLLKDKVGDVIEEQKLKDLYIEGERRYKKSIPPGYKDKNKDKETNDNKRYGDWIIWQSIIEKAKEHKTNIIFITNDRKEDWYEQFFGKIIGPRPELCQEFYDSTEHKIFYAYTIERFLEYAHKYLDDIPQFDDAIQEILDIENKKQTENIANQNTLYTHIISDKSDSISIETNNYCDNSVHNNE